VRSDFDIAIVGAGVSGLSFAHYAAGAGLDCLVLEQAPVAGGCIHTVRSQGGFWFELGAHTLYNSYGSLLDIIEAIGCKTHIRKRSKVPFRLLVEGRVRSVPSQLAMGELFASAWRAFVLRKAGRTVEEYYGRLVGKGNWRRVVGPLLAAPFSQRADAFPADMLFKRRPRRKDFPRSFTVEDGLGSLVEALSRREHVTVRTGALVQDISSDGARFSVDCADGFRARARAVVLATQPAVTARLLAKVAPRASQALGELGVAEVVSTGVVVAQQELTWPRVMGLAPLGEDFFSVVTRDVVEDDRFRGLAFHFPAGLSLGERLERISKVTGVKTSSFLHVAEHAAWLPSPRRGHPRIVAALDDALAAGGIYVTGNYFGGLSIEDCVSRSRAEGARLLRDLHLA
jgi:oxygen-dependent protoporphyrinogen oxidase